MTLDQAGIRCYHCYAGTLVHRGEWVWWWCPACNGNGCKECHRKGVLGVPKE